jgi:O-succinylbenzoic acid--CoA ligase
MDDPVAPDLLARAAVRWPDRIALQTGVGQWTFADLDYAAHEIAARVAAGSRVAFRAEMSPAAIASVWGIPRAGGIAVPLDPRLDVAAAAKLAESLGATIGWPPAADPGQAEPERSPGLPALIVATSGTSGRPRGVELTAGNIEAAAAASRIHLGTRDSDVWLLAMPLHHVAGLAILWRSAHDGSQIVLHERFEPGPVAEALRSEVTWVSLVPTMLRRILDSERGPWPGVRGALIGGARIADELIAAANRAGLPAVPTYGMTETGGQLCTVRPGDWQAAAGTVGHPLPGVAVSIAAPPGEPGVISVAGPTVSPGYVDELARSGPLATNDVGYVDGAGRLVVLGRGDEVVVTGGENVHPAVVERILEGLPGVHDAVVFGLPDEEWGERLVAVVGGEAAVPRELQGALVGALPRHAVPKEIRVVGELPRLSNGKVDRVAVRQTAAAW